MRMRLHSFAAWAHSKASLDLDSIRFLRSSSLASLAAERVKSPTETESSSILATLDRLDVNCAKRHHEILE